MRSLRARLILSHVLPLLVVIPLVGVALTYLFETQVLLAGLSNELARQATLVAGVAADYAQVWSDPRQAQAFAAWVGDRITARVWLLDPRGVLLASTAAADQPQVGQQVETPGLREVLLSGAIVRVDYGQQPGTGAAEVLVPVFINRQIAGVVRVTDPLSSVYERFPRTRTFITWVLLGGLVVGTGAGLLLAFDLERPLRRATQAISRMAGGEALAPLPEQGPAEVRLLLRAFNTLAERLQSLEKARRRLLANLVHELGRPLGALLSAIQALAGGAEGDPAVRQELLGGMDAEVRRMQHLLDDLTHLYDQTLGPLELDRQPTPLSSWLAQVLGPWREAAQDKGLHWQVDLPADLPVLEIDPDRLAQALGNVVSNAIKYTPAGGQVSVSAGTEAEQACIRVDDSGPGIAPEEMERIFTPLYRGAAGRRFPSGMGLGLSIARDLVAAHGGRIDLHSTPGAGSTFTLWLPR
ncbi:MAG TPA: HAMP domain-containing sensor histidine kinase [Anaerolineae bacterium]|nr:HAMP domain-containing sensor histidine kinase [Anaerolineae bacterium]